MTEPANQSENPVAEESNAIRRIAGTHDGQLLHRHLRRILEAVIDFQDAGALQAHTGRRSLARDLMLLMRDGIDDRSTGNANDPILAHASGPVGISTRARRDRSRYPRVDSFSDALNPDGTDPATSSDPPG